MQGKTVLEPSAGSGRIVEFCQRLGASVIACEIDTDLREILKAKCLLVGDDFLNLSSENVSHVDFIIMNPPFYKGAEHIIHAYNIAPPGASIVALCNWETINNTRYKDRQELAAIIADYGTAENIGDCFNFSKGGENRQTGVEVGLVKIKKAGQEGGTEYEGFFMDDEPEDSGQYGIMNYNFVRDLVHRYVMACKVFDEQLTAGLKMHSITNGYFTTKVGFHVTEGDRPMTKAEFKKQLQQSAWQYIFNKMNLNKHATTQLKEDINRFIQKQHEVPFTMRNIYRMLEIIIGTTGQRMDKATLEVFEKLTKYHDENRWHVEGWKTNSHYLVNRRFIFPYTCRVNFSGKMESAYHNHFDKIGDLEKVLCYLTGVNYDTIAPLERLCHDLEFGRWYDTHHFFRFRGYKKGTMHFEFKDEQTWALFNQKCAQLLGYPLFEAKGKRKEQQEKPRPQRTEPKKAEIVFEFDI